MGLNHMPDTPSIDFHARSMNMRRSQFWKVFPRRSDSVFDRSLARLSVLYEDLFLEVVGAGMEPETAPQLEPLGPAYRHVYFMRRAVATALEVKDVVEQIAVTPEFGEIEARAVSSKDSHYVREWVQSQKFFKSNRTLLKKIRDAVGGHFGDQAAGLALEAIGDDYSVGVKIEADIEGRVRVLLPFATELAATALLGNVPGTTFEEKMEALRNLLFGVVEHTVLAVHFLVEATLWTRMG
jgi:hypothetical protein